MVDIHLPLDKKSAERKNPMAQSVPTIVGDLGKVLKQIASTDVSEKDKRFAHIEDIDPETVTSTLPTLANTTTNAM